MLEKFQAQPISAAARRLTGLAQIAGGSRLRRFYIHVAQIEDVAMKTYPSRGPWANSLNPELESLLHPAGAFAHPRDVVADPDLTLNEKRAILASWASDACAVEAAPALRRPPGSRQTVSVDAILDALRDLDKAATDAAGTAQIRRHLRRRSIARLRSLRQRGGDNSGNSALQ